MRENDDKRTDRLLQSLTEIDEQYLLEAEDTPLNKAADAKPIVWKHGRICASMAAGFCALVILGTAYRVQFANHTAEPDTEESVAETALEYGDESAGDESAPAAETDNVDYGSYFQCEGAAQAEADYTLQAGGEEYTLQQMEDLPEMPFDVSVFSSGYANVFCNQDQEIENLFLHFENEETQQYLNLTISASGTYFACYPLENLQGQDRFGTTVYGFDYTGDSDDVRLELYFTVEDAGYGLESSGLSQEQLGQMMDGILQHPISLQEFQQ